MWQVEREEERERIARERKTERTKDHLEIYTLKFIKSVKNVCFLTTAFPRLVQDLQINPHDCDKLSIHVQVDIRRRQ